MTLSNQGVWFGRSRRQSRRWIGLGVVLLVITFSLHTPAIAEIVGPLGIPTGFRINVLPLVLLLTVIAGYLNDGVVVTLLLASGPIFGVFLPGALFDYPNFRVSIVPVVRTALIITLIVGTVGFVLGAGLHRLVAGRINK